MKTLDKLIAHRKERGLSRSDIARSLGVSDRTIFAWEREGREIPELTAIGIEAWLAKQNGAGMDSIEPLVDGIGKN